MAEINPAEVSAILKQQLANFDTQSNVEEVGTVLTIGDGISQKEGLEQPVYFWDPSVSPSGMDFYTGSIAEWKNNLMVGCLSGEKIIRLKIENNKVVGEEWLLENYGERFRDVLSSRDGHLYAVTDSGKLFRIRAK